MQIKTWLGAVASLEADVITSVSEAGPASDDDTR